MANLNSVSLVGRLVKDPEAQTTTSGKMVCRFTIAVDKRGKDAGVNFINCVTWEQRADYLSKYGKKGAQIIVAGRLDQQTWENKEGKKQSQITVIGDEVQLLSSVKQQSSGGSSTSEEGWVNGHAPTAEEFDKEVGDGAISYDDIPF